MSKATVRGRIASRTERNENENENLRVMVSKHKTRDKEGNVKANL